MSRTSLIVMALVVVAGAQRCFAQENDPQPRQAPLPIATGSVGTSGLVTPTPEMWFYEHELQRYDDPQLAIRRRAEERAQARRDRLESSRWYGVSNSRPMASPTPWCGGDYSAYWGSNSYDPMRWRPVMPAFVARPTARY